MYARQAAFQVETYHRKIFFSSWKEGCDRFTINAKPIDLKES